MAYNRWHAPPILERYDLVPETGCWEFSGQRGNHGYGLVVFGQFRTGDRVRILAHRYFYEQLVGPIPEGFFVCHRCDNPPCVNPAHLFVGTARDNFLDCLAKGRRAPSGAKGERNAKAKLTEPDVHKIRKMSGTHRAVAAKFGVSATNISQIRQRKIWRHV